MSGINTNVASLFAQNNLAKTGKSLSTAISRLSSGLRVNSAKDDAAGLAISERFRSQIIGQEVAKRNANDGISALEVAEGALGSITDALQRMRELANQSATGTLTSEDREQLDLEYQELSSEISRIIKDTNYNGIQLLSDDAINLDVQIGDKSTNNVLIKVGAVQSQFEDALVAATNSADFSANNRQTLAAVTLANITADPANAVVTGDTGAGTAGDKFEYDINDDGIADIRFTKVAGGNVESFSILDSNGQTVRSGSLGVAGTGITLADVTLGNLGFADESAADVNESGASSYTFRFGDVDVQLSVAAAGGNFIFTQANYNSANSIGGTDGSNARAALTKISTFLDQVSEQRAVFGAGINRLDSIINNLDTSITATSAARGRIIDADFAKETANLTRAQILQQAGTSVLAQANQLPSSVLSLLG